MRIFKNSWFRKFASKEGIQDSELKSIVSDVLEKDLAVDLGGGVYKVRVARSGKGKSGGYRVIVFFKSEDKTFFHYGFAKSVRTDINEKEKRVFKELAKEYLAMTDEQLDRAVKACMFIEI